MVIEDEVLNKQIMETFIVSLKKEIDAASDVKASLSAIELLHTRVKMLDLLLTGILKNSESLRNPDEIHWYYMNTSLLKMCAALSSSKTDEEINALTKKVLDDYVLFQSS